MSLTTAAVCFTVMSSAAYLCVSYWDNKHRAIRRSAQIGIGVLAVIVVAMVSFSLSPTIGGILAGWMACRAYHECARLERYYGSFGLRDPKDTDETILRLIMNGTALSVRDKSMMRGYLQVSPEELEERMDSIFGMRR